MNYERCMLRECKKCKYEERCFKKKSMNIQTININKLKPTSYNPRKDLKPGDEEYKKIKRSILEFGYVEPIVINKDYTVIGGHQRLKVLKDLDYTDVKCVVVDLNKNKEKALNLALNKITGEWDDSKLEKILAELKETDIDMDITGFSFDEIDDILKDITDSKEDDFDVEETLDKIKDPVTKTRDIWILGRHRLLCGDSTNKNNILHLMNKQEADMILTDPPYNVNYTGKTEEALTIKNDNLNENEFYNFLVNCFINMYEVAKYGCPFYVFHSDTSSLLFRNALKEANFKLAQCLIWVKNQFVMGRQDYQWQHEPILYRLERGNGALFCKR